MLPGGGHFNLSMDSRYRMIISRYLLREISGPLAAVLSVLAVLFTSYGAAGFLSDAVNGLLPTDTLVQVIGLRTLIALEVLIPISLYLAVIMALGRLYADSEITAMFALGLTPARLMGVVVGLSLCTALAVAGLSLVVRPWAYSRSHELASRAAAVLNTNNMEAGTFYVGGDGNRTIFIEAARGPRRPRHAACSCSSAFPRAALASSMPDPPNSCRTAALATAHGWI